MYFLKELIRYFTFMVSADSEVLSQYKFPHTTIPLFPTQYRCHTLHKLVTLPPGPAPPCKMSSPKFPPPPR